MRTAGLLATVLAWASHAGACSSCNAAQGDVVMVRNRPRMQPDALSAVTGPRAPLEWGQINFLHTTDTHGWLEGHVKQQNYGADWGDFVSFTKAMKQKAASSGVDLLLVDTGDLHDGAGLSDATSPNGAVSNPIFENIDYDLLAIGNHELYVSEIAYETFNQFSKAYGERYLTSNVQILNPASGQYEYIGNQYRYFTTPGGLRIMSFGFLYDFTGNSNVSRVIKAASVVNSTWFIDAVNYPQPIDLFVMIGHNPPRPTVGGSTFGTYFNAIRGMRPDVPIQIFGGHTHIRDFVVLDSMTTGLESGRYCETLGWLAMNGLPYLNNITGPAGYPHPTRPAIKVATSSSSSSVPPDTATASPSATTTPTPGPSATATASASSNLRYARRYLDWNRLTFEYHAEGSQTNGSAPSGSSSSSSLSSTTSTSSSYKTSDYPSTSISTSTNSYTTSPSFSSSSKYLSKSTTSTANCNGKPWGWQYKTAWAHCAPTKSQHTGKPATKTLSIPAYSYDRRQASPTQSAAFDTPQGLSVTNEIYSYRQSLNLTALYGCAPQSWCQSCAPFLSSGNIYSLLSTALVETVVNSSRATVPRFIILNTGSVRYDLAKGPFTYDDSFIVSPFNDAFQFIADVPYEYATKMLGQLNGGSLFKREAQLEAADFQFGPLTLQHREVCADPPLTRDVVAKRSYQGGRVIRRQSTNATTPGYTTSDDFGTDGDDTVHTRIPYYSQPNYFQANASLPTDGSTPATVDLIFLDYFASSVVSFLNADGATQFSKSSVQYYLPANFTTNSYLPAYAKLAADWQANVPNCPVL